MESACGLLPTETIIWVSGKRAWSKARVFIRQAQDKDTKEDSKIFLSMGGESSHSPIETNTKDSICRGYLMVLESTSGPTAQLTRGTFSKDIGKVKESSITLRGSASEANSSNRKLRATAK